MPARETTRRHLRNAGTVAALVALSLASTALLKFRIHHTDSPRYAFLTWNLALAWVPLAAALAADALGRRAGGWRSLALVPVAAVWLAFLPNAPYLCTDLIHLAPVRGMPFWYDQVMLAAYGVTGVLIGAASMLVMHDVAARVAGVRLAGALVAGAAVLAAFGIALGRFERLNSWEIFSRPALVLDAVKSYLLEPLTHSHALGWTAALSAFLLLVYLCVAVLTEGASRLVLTRASRGR